MHRNNTLMNIKKNSKKQINIKQNINTINRQQVSVEKPKAINIDSHSNGIVINNGQNITINGGNIVVNSNTVTINGKTINVYDSSNGGLGGTDFDYPVGYTINNSTSNYDIAVQWNGNGFTGQLKPKIHISNWATTESNTIAFNIYKTGTQILYGTASFAYGLTAPPVASNFWIESYPYNIIQMSVSIPTTGFNGDIIESDAGTGTTPCGNLLIPKDGTFSITFSEIAIQTLNYNFNLVNKTPYYLEISGDYITSECAPNKNITWTSDAFHFDNTVLKSNTWKMYWADANGNKTNNLILNSETTPSMRYGNFSNTSGQIGLNVTRGTEITGTLNPTMTDDIVLNILNTNTTSGWYNDNLDKTTINDTVIIPYFYDPNYKITSIQDIFYNKNSHIDTTLTFTSLPKPPIDISLNIINKTPFTMTFDASSNLKNIDSSGSEIWNIVKPLYDTTTSQINYNFLNGSSNFFPIPNPTISYTLGTSSSFIINNGVTVNNPVTLSGTLNGTVLSPNASGNIVIPDISSNAVIDLTFTAPPPAPYDISFVLINNMKNYNITGVMYSPTGSTNLIPNPPKSDTSGNTSWKLKTNMYDTYKYSTQWSFYKPNPAQPTNPTYMGGGSLNYDVISDFGIAGIGHNWSGSTADIPPSVSITAVDINNKSSPNPLSIKSIASSNANIWVPPFPTTPNSGNPFNFNKGGIITITYTD